jgi:hypothetical protein
MILYAVRKGRTRAAQSLITAFQQEWNSALPAVQQVLSGSGLPLRSLALDGAYGQQTATALYATGYLGGIQGDSNWGIPFTWNEQLLSRAFIAIEVYVPRGSTEFVPEEFWDAVRVFDISTDERAAQAIVARMDFRGQQSRAPSPQQVTSQTTAPGSKTMSQYADKLSKGAPTVGPDTGVVTFGEGDSVEHSFADEHILGTPQRRSINWAPWLLGAVAISAAGLIYARNR